MKILIGEDDISSSTLLLSLTKLWGYDPIAVHNGFEAWDILQQENPPNLILLDWEMPQLSGLGLCQKIRSQENSNPPYIVILTARKETSDIVTALEMGANEYITKPFNRTELQARLHVGKRMLLLQQELNKTRKQLEFQANHDELTRIYNRKAILEKLDIELARTERQHQNFCVALCDIDFFKMVNDQYGHLAGDFILQQVAKTIKNQLRPYDNFGRYGGEEFLLITNEEWRQAQSTFERIRSTIENTEYIFEDQLIKITLSFGVTFHPSDAGHKPPLELVNEADVALYKAKECGRNQVQYARPVEGQQSAAEK